MTIFPDDIRKRMNKINKNQHADEEKVFIDKKIGKDSPPEDFRDAYIEYSRIMTEKGIKRYHNPWITLPNFTRFVPSYAFRLLSNYVKQSHSSILDVGSGMGHQVLYWKSKGFDRVEGCDIAVHFASNYISKGIPFKMVDLNREDLVLPYNDNEFDIVTCSHVLEHIKYPKVVIEELVRVSKDLVILTSPIGKSHFSVSHINFWDNPKEIARDLLNKEWAFSIELVISNLKKDIRAVIDIDGSPKSVLRQMCFIAVIYKQFSEGNEWMWGDSESIAELRKKRADSFLFLSTEEDLFSEDVDDKKERRRNNVKGRKNTRDG